MIPIVAIVPGLVGRWEMQPDNQEMPKAILMIEGNSAYLLTSSDDRSQLRGTIYTHNRQRARRATSEPSRGQMTLYDETTGKIGTMSFDFTGDGEMEIIGMSGTKYVVRRQ